MVNKPLIWHIGCSYMKRKITDLALAGKCGAFAAITASADARPPAFACCPKKPSACNIPAIAVPKKPLPAWVRN